MGRVTFDMLVKAASMKGLEVERVGESQIDVWVKANNKNAAECGSVSEAYLTVYNYEPGKRL